ncbi:MAG TPA: HEAT repeat domain-containing protein, partial [Rudaea sp.]|nr:HEAT repeat domain-containing protein [Rudaea sp.]
MRSFAVWLVVACTFLAVPAMPAIAQSRVTGTQVDALLGAYEGVEPTQWRGLGKGAIPILESIAADQSVLPTRRARSVDGLAALGSGERTMRTLANSNTEPLIVRMSAVRGLGQLLPAAAMIDALRPLLQDAQWQVRGVAAETLSMTAGGCAFIADMAKQETDAWRYRFVRGCGAQPPPTTTTTPQAPTSGDPTSRVIVYKITDPTPTVLYSYPSGSVKVLAPTLPGAFAVLVPNAPSISLLSGSWKYNLFATAPTTVNVEALIKSPSFVPLTSGTVNANLFFVGVNGLTAASAPADANFQAILSKVNGIYAQIGLQLGNLTYIDITGADATAYTDIADDTERAALMRLSANAQASDFAINLFFVHSITGGMGGYVILGESAGIPGVPIRGSSGSGVAV